MFTRPFRHSLHRTLFFTALIALICNALVQRFEAATLDTTFGSGGRFTTTFPQQASGGIAVYFQPSGRIVVLSGLYGVGAQFPIPSLALVGLKPNGTLDPTFGTGGKTQIGTFGYSEVNYAGSAMQTDGKILIYFSTWAPDDAYTNFILRRFTADGQPDPTFNASVPSLGDAPRQSLGMALSPDGKITVIAGGTAHRLVRLNSDGSRDQSFGADGVKPWPILRMMRNYAGMAFDAKGKLTIGFSNGSAIRVDQDGNLDRSFGSQGVARQYAITNVPFSGMTRQADGKILFAVATPNIGLFRYTEKGRPDTSFGVNGLVNSPVGPTTSRIGGFALQPDGKIIAAGFSNLYGITPQGIIAKYAANGSLEQYSQIIFPDLTTLYLTSVAIQPDGKIIVAGSGAPPTVYNNPATFVVLRLTDTKFGQGALGRLNDFDGDGRTDLSVYRRDPAGIEQSYWAVQTMSGTLLQTYFGVSEDLPVPQDFNDDGKTDVAVFRPSNGTWYYKTDINADTFTAVQFGQTGDIPIPNDYDGDRKADLVVFRPSTATWYIRNSSDGSVTVKQFGQTGLTPVTGDFDGDGKADLATFDPQTAGFAIQRSSDGLVVFIGIGASVSGASPVVADYDGDRRSDVGYFTSTGTWRYVRSFDNQTVTTTFGTQGDIPVPGDYSGDGLADIGVFRPSEGNWIVTWSGNGGFTTQFGQNGDVPLPGR